jgi:hypothetical protein
MPRDLKSEQECRIVFAEIIGGYSRDPKYPNLYLKHYTELDLSHTECVRQQFIEDGCKQGLMTEKDKLNLLAEKGHWSPEEEKKFIEAREHINQLYFSLKKLIPPNQIEHMKGTIIEEEKKFQNEFGIRVQLLGTTVEHYATQRASENHVLRSFFKDAKLQVPYFTEADVDELSKQEVGLYIDIYNSIHSTFFDKNFKRIAVCSFFLNGYRLSEENAMTYFGKPVIDLTIYQMALFNRGHYYKNIQSDPEFKSPPEEYYEDLDKVVKFYDQQYSIILSKHTKNQLITTQPT